MGLRAEISGKMEQARRDKAVEQPPRQQQRRIGQYKEETGGQKVRQTFEIIELDAADAVDVLVGSSCFWFGSGLSAVFLTSSGERKPPLTCIIRKTVNHDMLTALRIMTVAAMT
jgi:hypothetical protein